jgi:hypothetical protein
VPFLEPLLSVSLQLQRRGCSLRANKDAEVLGGAKRATRHGFGGEAVTPEPVDRVICSSLGKSARI